jgi:hypothetical protein
MGLPMRRPRDVADTAGYDLNARRPARPQPVTRPAWHWVVNFNGVGGGTVMYTAHFPRLHPSDFRVKSLDGVAED